MTTSERHLALIPRDGLFCKDGRGWHTSASGRGHALDWPWPATVLGAIRTAWGRMEEQRRGKPFDADEWRRLTAVVRLGRTLALRRPPGAAWTTQHRVWPVPADALWLEGGKRVYRLDPLPSDIQTLGRDDDAAREALWWPRLEGAGKPLPGPRWWSEGDFCAWLAGQAVPVRDARAVLSLSRRIQVHVQIGAEELTAAESGIFSHDVLETLERNAEWALGVEAEMPAGDLPTWVTLGSDSRPAGVENLPRRLFDPPTGLVEAFRSGSPGLRLVVITPACFRRGWLPDGLERRGGEYRGVLPHVGGEILLRAAFVPRPVHISGWDMAANNGRGAPKPTARMVAPGAVYFCKRADGRPFSEADARSLWLAAVGSRTEEGFGRIVPGVWTPKRGE